MTVAEFIAFLRKAGVKDTDRIDYMDFLSDDGIPAPNITRIAFDDPEEPAEVRVEN